jgi:hypothetical protein
MVILGEGSQYPDLTACLQDNQVDPTTAAEGAHLVVYRIINGVADIVAQGLKVRTDGQFLVLGLIPEGYALVEGLPILGTSGEVDAEPDEPTERSVSLEGCRVADGAAYKRWRGGGTTF